MTPEEQLAAEKAAQEAKEKADKESQTPQSLETALAELARTRDALTAANHEAAERRKKLSAFEAAELKRQDDEKKRRDAELTETEKLKNQLAEAENKRKQIEADYALARLHQAIEREATALGFQNPEDAYLLADVTTIEIGEDGKVKGAKEAIEKLAKERAYLLKSEKPTPPNLNSRETNKKGDAEKKMQELYQRFPRLRP